MHRNILLSVLLMILMIAISTVASNEDSLISNFEEKPASIYDAAPDIEFDSASIAPTYPIV